MNHKFNNLFSVLLLSSTSTNLLAKEDGIAKTPAMGWNSWNHFACDITEDLIKATADAMIDLGLHELGYSYVNLDDCWQASTRSDDGKIQPDSTRFPSGMKNLGDYIHSKGLKFGIYSSAGFKTCQAFPASLGMETVDANTYAEWGVDYLKYDNCYTDFGPPTKRYPAMANALEASGRDILYSLCEWGRSNPSAWAGDISHSWRVTGDIRDDWRSILTRAAVDVPLWRYARPGAWNDPDMLEVGNGKCSYEEYKSHFSMWAMLKSPLIIGNDIRQMTKNDEAYEILTNKDVIAVNQDSLGWQSRRIWSDRSPKSDSDIWSRGTGVIATYCASNDNISNRQQDNILDQQWIYQSDGTILNIGTQKCLSENIWNDNEPENLKDDSDILLSEIDLNFGRGSVKIVDCSNATKWDIEAHAGGHIVSRTSGSCVGVDNNPIEIMTNGRRISMSKCSIIPIDFHRMIDISEHQSWTRPQGSNGILLNLYQRQCLTVDHDAPVGLREEIWSTKLSTGELVVMMLNKGKESIDMTVTWEQLGLPRSTSVTAYDLWKHETISLNPKASRIALPVASHGVAMFKLTIN